MNDIRDFRGVWVCDLFTEYIPARLVRLNRLVLTIVIHYYEYIIVALRSLYARARNVHLLDERLDYFFMSIVVALNVFVQLFAYGLIFNVHLLFAFPPGVRIHPILNYARLVAGRHVNEFFDVGVAFVSDPFIGLHVHGLALQVRAVNRAQVHVHAPEVIHDNGADALHDAVVLREFQILQRDFQRFDKVAQLDGVLALRVQKHVQVELRVVRRDDIAVPDFGRHLLYGLNELLVLLRYLPQHLLVFGHHLVTFIKHLVVFVKHIVPIIQQHLHHGLQIHQLFVFIGNALCLFGHGRNFFFHHSQ